MNGGGELFLPCEGGPVGWRRVPDPPPLEIVCDDGILVLDDRDPADLRYVFIAE